MHRTVKKLLAVLLAACMLLALLPALTVAEEPVKKPGRLSDEILKTGYIAPPAHGTHAVADAYRRGDMETYYRLTGRSASRDTLPSSYNSNSLGYVTSVKNQNPYGSCWAHAAMASVESYMIKHGVEVGSTGSAATTSLNLSETQHCFFNYSDAYDADGMLTGDRTVLAGSDNCLEQGGNGEMSAYTLQSWVGAANEADASALKYENASDVASDGLDSVYSYQYDVAHVQNSEWISGADIEGVKRAIMRYGAGNISYYETGYAYTYICTIDNTSQNNSNHKWSNHAITVVGWDDSIAASRFSPDRPSSPGAWICKNSWGTGYFSDGYCYISYEDTTVLEGSIYFYDAEPVDNYDHNYQYDGTCNLVCYGKGWPSGEDYYVGFANDTKVANVFTANGNETLEAVALCSWDEALSYTVEIYKNPTVGNPTSGTLMTSQSGTLTYTGYYTIPLDNPVTLTAGDTFSVVFTQSVAEDGGVHTPYDASFDNSSVVDWVKWVHADRGATSYYKEPNGSWTDCPDNGDYRIKAYTKDITYNVTAVSNNTAWGTVSVSGTKITASPADGYYVAGYEVISGTATATINVNIINVAPTSDCTIRIIFAEKPTCIVNYQALGQPAGSDSALIYDTVTLPGTVSSVPDGWTFAGWATAEVAETAAAPAFYAPGAVYTVTGNTTLYALFTCTEYTGQKIYRLVNDNLSDWTGNYIITCGRNANALVLKGLSGNTSYESTSAGGAATFENTGMTLDGELIRNANNAYVFKVAARDSAYTIQNASTNTYLGSYNSYLYSRTSYSGNYCKWSPEYDLYNICMKVSNSASSSYPYLTKSSYYAYFVINSDYTSSKTQFWKEEDEIVTYYNTELMADGFYLIGPDWNLAAIDPANGFVPNPENANEYMLETTLAVGDKIKVVRVVNNAITNWYPEGTGNEYTVDAAHAGNVTVYFKTTYDSAWSAFGGYIWIAERTPEFKNHQLFLSDQIGVRFFVDLSMLSETDRANANVTFAITGKGASEMDPTPVALDPNKTNGSGYYGFDCLVNSIQMADTITATLHYGNNQTVTDTYSVRTYVQVWEGLYPTDTGKVTTLLHALADFGHYVQPYLATINGFTVGTDYAAMDKFYAQSYDVEAIKTAAAAYRKTVGGSDAFKAPSTSLVLDSKTAIRVFLAHADNTKLDLNNVQITVTPQAGIAWPTDQWTATQSGNRILVEIRDVKASWLDKNFTVTVTEGTDSQTVTLSALSYVEPFLNTYSGNTAAQNAICAFYQYAMASISY